MSNLLTQCPFCQTSFKVREEQMQVANGVVRCGSCMEVFLADQHRIVLKDKTVFADTTDLPDPDPDEEVPLESENNTFESTHEDSVVPVDTPEDDDPGHPVFLSESANEESEESITSAVFEEDDPPDSDDILIFGPWSDKEGAEAESSVEEKTGDDQDTLLSPWDIESFQSSEIFEEDNNSEEYSGTEENPPDLSDEFPDAEQSHPESAPENNFASFLNPGGYSMQEFSVDHILPTQASNANRESKPDPDNERLEENAESRAEPEAEASEIPDFIEDNQSGIPDRIGNLESIDASMDFSGFSQTSENEVIETDFDVDTDETIEEIDALAELKENLAPESIPTLVPDLVARENIPASLGTQSMAWLQSVPEQSSPIHTPSSRNDYTSAEDKAVIISRLSELEDEDSLAPLAQENLEAIDEEPVELIKTHDAFRVLKTTVWVSLCVLLIIGLPGQYLFFNLVTLVSNPRYDNVTSFVCRFLDCPDNQVIDLTSLVTEELDVRTHPTREDALQVNFIFRNDSAREQLFPLVELNFTDISGDILANRVFSRSEYLPPEMELFTHMPAHSSIQVSLEMVDPGSQATGYSLVFRNP